MRENHYAIPCIKSKISQVSNYKISITLLILSICRGWVLTFPTAKIQNFYETPDTERAKVSWYGNFYAPM